MQFKRVLLPALVVGMLSVFAPRPANAQFLGPTPYLAFDGSAVGAGTAISPFSSMSFSDYFHLETFEDNLVNTPGVTDSGGMPLAPGGITDSIDADDGAIDGFGIAGHSYFGGSGFFGVSFTFDALALGGLPTHAGLVWTDGFFQINFQAFDANDVLIGTLVGDHADEGFGGTTGEDRFYGVITPGGISRMFMNNFGGGIEVDHLQYGRGAGAVTVPESGTFALLASGFLVFSGVVVRRHRNV